MANDMAARIEDWRKRLLDLTGRNQLISCRIGPRAAIDIRHPSFDVLWEQFVLRPEGGTFRWKRDFATQQAAAQKDGLPQNVGMQNSESPATLNDPFDETIDLTLPADGPESDLASHRGAVADAEGNIAERAGDRVNEPTLDECLSSSELRNGDLLTEWSDQALATRLKTLAQRAREAQAEAGIDYLYLVFGCLEWFESADSEEPIVSPLLLFPVGLSRKNVDAPWRLSAAGGEIVTNPALRERLRLDFQLTLPEWEAEEELGNDALSSYLGLVRQAIGEHPRWTVQSRVVLGQFSSQKLAMWHDLGENHAAIAEHPICRALAGLDDGVSQDAVPLPALREFDDRIPPREWHSILDADSSQQEVLLAAKRGLSLVVDGPPGTGKSQTIANLIAETLAAGKTVLFVSEKTAALQVVKRHLDQANLGDFCLELHSGHANRKELVKELDRCLALSEDRADDDDTALERLETERRRLNQYVRAVHQKCSALKRSPYQVYGRLAQLFAPDSQCPLPNVLDFDASMVDAIKDLLQRLTPMGPLLARQNSHPWRGCRIQGASLTLVGTIRSQFASLATECEQATVELRGLVEAGLVPSQAGYRQIVESLDEIERLLSLPETPAAWFTGDLRATIQGIRELHRHSLEVRGWERDLGCWRTEALTAASAAKLIEVADGVERAMHGLRNEETLRGWLGRLQRRGQLLEGCLVALQGVAEAIANWTGLFQIVQQKQSLVIARQLVTLGRQLVEIGPLHADWLEPVEREKLKQVAASAEATLASAQSIRDRLAGRMAPLAFAAESAALVDQARGYERWWRRLLPGWNTLRRQLSNWYPGPLPTAEQLFRDLRDLKQFHASRRLADEWRKQHAGRWIAGANGEPDWGRTSGVLTAAERLADVLRKNERLRRHLLEGDVRIEAVQAATQTLETRLAAAERSCDEVAAELGVASSARLIQNSFEQVRSELESQLRAVQRLEELFSRTATLLHTDGDVPLSRLRFDAARMVELEAGRETIAGLAQQLRPVLGTAENPAQVDWSGWAKHADLIAGVLDLHGEPPPAGVVQLLVDPTQRTVARAAVQQVRQRLQPTCGWQLLEELFALDQSISDGLVLQDAPLVDLADWLRRRCDDVEQLEDWISFREVCDELRRQGLDVLLQEILQGRIPLDQATAAFERRFYLLWLDAVHGANPALSSFRVEDHERLIERFRKLDKQVISQTAGRIRRRLLCDPQRPRSGSLQVRTVEEKFLLSEVNKKRSRLPVRKILTQAGPVVQRLKPCFMMSPLAVSTYLGSLQFDLVVFDEASQVRPQDAIGALYRGKQVVVAGDDKQLPPTSFFEREVQSDEDDEDASTNYESILDNLKARLPHRTLRWHYRSRREALIAFSNHHIYENRLFTFPSPQDADGSGAVRLVHVADGCWLPGEKGCNPIEAARVADLVLEHARQSPDESLGIIAMSVRQQQAIDDAIEKLRRSHPDFDAWWQDEQRDWDCFVKNLENVQGDERDRIILSIGYGKDKSGVLRHQFGPLQSAHGYRRLNVAVTRARQRMDVVSSIRAADIDLQRAKSQGANLLRDYLDYAERGVGTLGREAAETGLDHDSEFERAVESALRQRGLMVRRQVGCANFRIDLALVDPQNPGRYVLGIECDGARYHSSATARDRDRLRQHVLEGLGWRICRIWSTDWTRNPTRQLDRVVREYEQALRLFPKNGL